MKECQNKWQFKARIIDSGLCARAIENLTKPTLVNVNGGETSYICHACKQHSKSGKLPPMSTNNGLRVYNHDADMELTELEPT